MPSATVLAHSIPDAQLGLNHEEIQSLRYHQHVVLSQAGSSRAASQASSQGRLLLDPGSLQALSTHFDRLMFTIQQRWTSVCHFRIYHTQFAFVAEFSFGRRGKRTMGSTRPLTPSAGPRAN